MPGSPRKGEILQMRDGGTNASKPRPFLVLSRVELNGRYHVLGAPFSTKKLDERSKQKQCIIFEAGEFGLLERCALLVDSITTVDFNRIDTTHPRIGVLTPSKLAQVEMVIRYVFALN